MIMFGLIGRFGLIGLCTLLAACLSSHPLPGQSPSVAATPVRVTPSPRPAASTPVPVVARSGPTLSPLSPSPIAAVPSATSTSEPDSPLCQQPSDDYTRVKVNGHPINARTLWMLKRAAALYHGRGSPLNVIQGSYTDALAASFGTHAGGGAVDISVRVALTSSVVLSETEQLDLVRALREAGFAAWLRFPADLKPPVALHIHAIAIGDAELSEAARQQLDGPEGYFRGDDGVPPAQGGPHRDRYGGPVMCGWMTRLGFADLR
jgi:hypothetical protein